jgi:hypothetical protein
MPELPQVVRERLASARTTSSHPDPDVLTAFSERLLPAGERDVVLEHLARCGDCREIIALALPETESVPSPVLEPRRSWFGSAGLRWAIVAAGIVAVASVAFLEVRNHQTATVAHESQNAAPALPPVNQPMPGSETAVQLPVTGRNFEAPVSSAKNSGVDSIAGESGKALAQPSTSQTKSAPMMKAPLNGLVANHAFHGSVSEGKAQQLSLQKPSPDDRNHSYAYSTATTGGNQRSYTVGGPINGIAVSDSKTEAKLTPPPVLLPSGSSAPPPASQASASAASQPTAPQQTQQSAAPSAVEAIQVQSQSENIQVSAANNTLDQFSQDQQATELPQQGRVTQSQQDLARASVSPPGNPGYGRTRSPLWSVTSSGSLQRSNDGGKTWLDVNVGDNPMVASMFANSVEAAKKAKSKTDASDSNNDKQVAANQPAVQDPNADRDANKDANKKARDEKAANEQNARTRQASVIFRAVSSLSSEVWAGGSAGVLYHSPDGGVHWIRVVPVTTGTILTSDIVAVEQPSPQFVKIATSNSEVWITNDDGRTWQKQ